MTNRNEPRILFVHNGTETFVRQDHALLRQFATIENWHQPGRAYDPAKLLRAVRSSDVVFCWFASWHALAPVLLARRLGKPAIVVVGGYDTANVPQAGYGAMRGGLPRIVARLIIRQATHLITNSQAARAEAIRNGGADERKLSVIYHILRKGLLPFVEAAAHLPDVRFVQAGAWRDDGIEQLRAAAGPNVDLRGFVDAAALAALYSSAAVYVQPSLHEGFGLSVAEAMTAGCIPVVSRAGSLPEVVGDAGVVLSDTTPAQIAASIRQALRAPAELRHAARERVLTLFPMARRAAALRTVIEELLVVGPLMRARTSV
jgi:glycosyltransferase involved in cell wall biosynthesis